MGNKKGHTEEYIRGQSDTISKYLDDGFTTSEIADMMYLSKSTINKRIRKYNLRYKKVFYDKGVYKRMCDLSLTDDMIAHIWGVTYHALQSWKSRNGISRMSGQVINKEEINWKEI